MKTQNAEKVIENIKALGLERVEISDSLGRSHVRKLLNGLGFETENYIHLGYGALGCALRDGLMPEIVELAEQALAKAKGAANE